MEISPTRSLDSSDDGVVIFRLGSAERRQAYAVALSWALLGLVPLAMALFFGLMAAVGSGRLGEGGHILASRCTKMGGGRGSSFIQCEGRFEPDSGTAEDRAATVRYPGHPGDAIRVYRAPWGTYEALEDGFMANVHFVGPVLLVGAGAGCLIRGAIALRRETY